MKLQELVTSKYGRQIAECSTEEIYVALLEATRITLRNALNLIGISAPEKM
mgnify:CR=1 FL=1